MAEAFAVQKRHGADGPAWIASRIGALALAGDWAEVERFRSIAAAYERLLTATVR